MARNFMADYDPGNTTGWKNSGQVETRQPDGSTKTSIDKNTDTNPSYDPQAPIGKSKSFNAGQKQEPKKNIFNNIYNKFNKVRYNTTLALPGQRARIEKYRRAYAKYLKDQGMQVPDNLEDTEDLYSFFGSGAFDKNKNFLGGGTYTEGKAMNVPYYMDYGEFMAKKMGSPGIKYSGNVGGLEKYVSGYKKNSDGTFQLTAKGNKIPDTYDYRNTGEGGGGNYYNQFQLNNGLGEEEVEPIIDETETFAFDPNRFGPGGDAADVTRASYIFNQGGRVPRNMGGIMNAVPRQGYFLGKLVKGVKSAVSGVAKAAGKVLKSDAGKMALTAAAFYYGGGGASAFKNKTFTEGLKTMGGNFFSKSNPLLFTDETFNPLKFAGLTTLGGMLAGPAKQDASIIGDRGGRMPDFLTGGTGTPAELRESIQFAIEEADGDPVKLAAIDQKYNNMLNLGLPDNLPYKNYALFAGGGRVPAQEGGLMNLGGMEKDYRAEGGFVPIGKEEKADDVPARLSVNEFVFTADAVRNAGGGDIDRGAEVMENMMKNLENGGTVSEESQGNAGAQGMFSVSERIGEVI